MIINEDGMKMMPRTVHCDKCYRELAMLTNSPKGAIITGQTWDVVEKPKKGAQGHTKRYDFCDEKCRMIYFRGARYWRNKMEWIEANKKAQEIVLRVFPSIG